ncbi:MAG: LacI family DNA-binding transcriptional regulator [Rhizobiaceae bacterium]
MSWKGPTITQIANASGVGTATVDRVLNGRSGVGAATRQKVLQAIEQLSKPSHASGQAPKRRVAVLADSGTSFNQTLQDSIERFASFNQDFDISFSAVATAEVKPVQLAQLIERTAEDAQAIILVAREEITISRAIRSVTGRNIPVVCLTTDIPGSNRILYVGSDQAAAGSTAAGLMGKTLRGTAGKILLVFSAAFRGQAEREMGFRSVLRSDFPNLKVDERVNSNDNFETSYGNLRRYIAEHGAPVGIYNVGAGNLGIAQALKDEGLTGKVVFIGHELNANSRMLLETGAMDYAIGHDLEREVAIAFGALRNVFSGSAVQSPPRTPVRIYTRHNCAVI